MSRRYFLKSLILPLLSNPLTGCTFMNEKKHINTFGKVFDYLKDPALRVKEVGDQVMEVKGALISGISFQGMVWKNTKFIECDFTEAYQIKLEGLQDILFDGCRFAGIFGFGLAKRVRFNRAEVRAKTYIFTEAGSTNVVLENCDFRSLSDNPDHWGAIAMRGEAKYVNCYAKWFDLVGEERLDIERCKLDTVRIASGDKINPPVTIIDTELLGTTDMVSSHMSSLTMRNCTVGVLDLKQAHVSGDVLIEKVAGEKLLVGVVTARSMTIRNCKIVPVEGEKTAVDLAAMGIEQLRIEGCTFGDRGELRIDPGVELRDDQWTVGGPKNKLTYITRCTMESLDATWTESQDLRIEQCTISSADFSNSRIGHLQIEGSTISQKLDLRNTRIQTHSIKDLEPSKYRQVLLDGSSIKQLSI